MDSAGRPECDRANRVLPSPRYLTTTSSTVPKALVSPTLGVMEQGVRLPKYSGPERRASVRFPLALEVLSVSRGRGLVGARLGNMIDISSSGLRFATPGPLEPGKNLAVTIDWPVLLDGRVQLRLIVAGTVVWSTASETAIRI